MRRNIKKIVISMLTVTLMFLYAPERYIKASEQSGTFGFSSATGTVSEEESLAKLPVIRTGGTDGIVTVGYKVIGGSATKGEDYILSDGTLRFDNGDTNKNIIVNIIDDSKYEGNETLEVQLYSVSGGSLGGITTYTLTIQDNDPAPAQPGTFGFSSATGTVPEEESLAKIPVTRTGGTDGVVTVSYKVIGGSATAGSDYILSDGTIRFDNGDTNKDIIVNIIDDSKYEINETVEVQLSSVSGGSLGGGTTYTLTIQDNDAAQPGTFAFSSATATVAEGTPTANLEVIRIEGTDGKVSVDYKVTGGNAANGSDYTLTDSTLTFEDGETSKVIPVTIKEDTFYEGDETVIITLNNAQGGAAIGSVSHVTLTIKDNDSAPTGGSTGSSTGGGGSTTLSSEQKLPIIVDGKTYNIGGVEVHKDQTTITVDRNLFVDKIQASEKGSSVIVPATSNTGTLLVQFDGQSMTNMNKKEMMLEIKTDDVSYTIPTVDINNQEILASLGQNVKPDDIKITVTVANVGANKQQEIQQVASQNDLNLIGTPMAFEVNVSYKDKVQEISRFSQFVSRQIEISKEDVKKITTAVVCEEDGTFRHVPTYVFNKDNQWYAKINSRTNSTYALIENHVSFKDTVGKWYETTVTEMASRKIVNGVGPELFEGERTITRAEFSAIIVTALGLPLEDVADFSDVSSTAWYSKPIASAVHYGLVEGVGEGKFSPNDPITREAAMVMIERAAKLTPFPVYMNARYLEKEFSDLDSASAWAREAVDWNLNNQLVTGINGEVRPKDKMTRAEVTTVVLRLLQQAGLVDVRSQV